MIDRLVSITRYTLPRLAGFVKYPARLRPNGDIVCVQTLDGPDHTVQLLSRLALPLQLADAYYSPEGLLLQGRTAFAHGCIETPAMPLIRQGRRHRSRCAQTIEHATVLGMQHPMSYGDWFRQGLLMLCEKQPSPPVLLPAALFAKSYVQRDAQRLGIQLQPVPSEGIHIRHATAIYLDGGFHEWLPKDIAAIRAGFKITPPPPQLGSLLYLSREGEHETGVRRHYPSLIVEEFVRSIGGRVVRCAKTSLDDYIALAPFAETVIADHGSAQCNLAWWQTRRVIELRTTHHNDYFITLAAAAGVREQILVSVADVSEDAVVERVKAALAQGR